MVSLNQIEHGLGRWVDAELLPHLSTGGQYDNIKRLGVAAGTVYIIRKGKAALATVQGNQFLQMLGVVDASGGIDLEGLKNAVTEKIPETGLKVPVPVLGEVTFFKKDIESMYAYIMGG